MPCRSRTCPLSLRRCQPDQVPRVCLNPPSAEARGYPWRFAAIILRSAFRSAADHPCRLTRTAAARRRARNRAGRVLRPRPAPARPRACRRRWSTPAGSSCCSRDAWPRGPSPAASPTSRAGRSAAKSAGRSASSAASTRDTRLLVVTEGILTACLQHDPLLSDFATVVFDEFHERSIHADLGLALARQAWLARDDLRIVVMSATLDAARWRRSSATARSSTFPGRSTRCEIEYAPGPDGRRSRCAATCRHCRGEVLCFLPGAAEIDARAARVGRAWRRATTRRSCRSTARSTRTAGRGAAAADRRRAHHPRHQHRRNLADRPGRDRGRRHRPAEGARYDAARGDRQPRSWNGCPQDAADQRAGRAARTGPGLVRPAVGRARSAAARARAGHPPRRPVRTGAGRARLGRRSPPPSSGSMPRQPGGLTAALALLRRLGRRRRWRRHGPWTAARPAAAASPTGRRAAHRTWVVPGGRGVRPALGGRASGPATARRRPAICCR